MDRDELRVDETSETLEFVRDIESSFEPKSWVNFGSLGVGFLGILNYGV